MEISYANESGAKWAYLLYGQHLEIGYLPARI